MDTGKKLWEVSFRGVPLSFNIVAKDAAEAETKARLCVEDLHEKSPPHEPLSKPGAIMSLQVNVISFQGTLDEPKRRRKAVR